jgi:hypothetical protein
MDELCAGLHYAHRAGIVHRDIKPANIMLDEEGLIKILDFGIARLGASGMTQAGMVMGTLNYMAPEQMEGKPIDARADMFSAGALFYELLSYRRAFPGELPGILHQIMSGSPEPLKTLVPALDAGLVAIVNRCLEKTPEQRYPELAAVRRELAAVRQRLETQATSDPDMTIPVRRLPVEMTPPSGTPAKSPRRDSSREERLRIRAAQIQGHIDAAREAIGRDDFDAALQACHQALLLDPENSGALELEDRARTAIDRRQVQEWVREARNELERGAFTAASLLVERALSLTPTSPDAIDVQRAVEQARRELADAQERAAQQERARAIVVEARRQFATGDHRGAIERLATHQPAHELVTHAAAELTAEAEEIERRRLEAQQRRQEEARRQAEEEARRREEDERRRREEEERRRAEAARAAAEAAERLRREIAQKLTDASARLAQKDFDGAFALTRAILATSPKHPDALAVDAQIKHAFERHRQVVTGLAAARALYERGRFQETLDAIGRLALIDPSAAGLAELRRAAETGIAEAEAAEARRREREEAERRRQEEERRKAAEEEARQRAAHEAKQRAEEEARRRAEEEAKRRADQEAKRRAEQEARQREEQEARRRAEEEAKRLAAADAARRAEEEKKRQAEAQTVVLTPAAAAQTPQEVTVVQPAVSELGVQPQSARTLPSPRILGIAAAILVVVGGTIAIWLGSGTTSPPTASTAVDTNVARDAAPRSATPSPTPTTAAVQPTPVTVAPAPIQATPSDPAQQRSTPAVNAPPPAALTPPKPQPPVEGRGTRGQTTQAGRGETPATIPTPAAPPARPPAPAPLPAAAPTSPARSAETPLATTPLREREAAPRPLVTEPTPIPSGRTEPAAPAVAAPAPQTDDSAIRDALQRYRSGYESLDAAAVQSVYPGIDARALAAVFREYVSLTQSIQIDRIDIAPDGRTATVIGAVTTAPVVRTGRASPQRRNAIFMLRKRAGTWMIESVKLG